MLRFFFNRFSMVVLLMEIVGICLVAIGAYSVISKSLRPAAIFPFVLVFAEYLFIRYCASRRWYEDAPRWLGIELHFKKAMVPTSYMLAILGICLLTVPPQIPLLTAAALLAVVAHVNVILLYLHHKDTDPSPVNFFSRGKSGK